MRDSTHVLAVPVLEQRTEYECGPTCLAAIVRYLGRHVSLEEMAELAGTTQDGTDHANLVEAALRAGAGVFVAEGHHPDAFGEVTDFLRRGLPVIAGWWSMEPGDHHFDPGWDLATRKRLDRGHYSVIRGFTRTGLLLMDPIEGYLETSDTELAELWYDTDTDAYQRVDRWYMVLSYEELRDVPARGVHRRAPGRTAGT